MNIDQDEQQSSNFEELLKRQEEQFQQQLQEQELRLEERFQERLAYQEQLLRQQEERYRATLQSLILGGGEVERLLSGQRGLANDEQGAKGVASAISLLAGQLPDAVASSEHPDEEEKEEVHFSAEEVDNNQNDDKTATASFGASTSLNASASSLWRYLSSSTSVSNRQQDTIDESRPFCDALSQGERGEDDEAATSEQCPDDDETMMRRSAGGSAMTAAGLLNAVRGALLSPLGKPLRSPVRRVITSVKPRFKDSRKLVVGALRLPNKALVQIVKTPDRSWLGRGAGHGTDEFECSLTEDVYSLMYIAPTKSVTMGFALFICFFQLTLLILVLIDQVSINENPLSIPPSVEPQVAVAQAMCMILAVAVQQDLIQTVTCFHSGHSDELTKDVPEATYRKFVFSNALHFVIGSLLLVNTFNLIMSSDNVIDVFLNFAGLEFISLIDDVGFTLGKNGFITESVRTMCDATQWVKQPVARNLVFRRVCYLVVSIGLGIGFGIIQSQQGRGDYICSRLFVQFSDDFRSEYSGFSGVYVRQPAYIDGRVYYVEANSFGKSKRSMLAYCIEEAAWTHSWWDPETERPHSCEWEAISEPTKAYDILDTTNWQVYNDETDNVAPFQHFVLMCYECDGEDRGSCDPDHGTCVNGECVCHPGKFGVGCVFEDTCAKIRTDHSEEFHSFPSLPDGAIFSEAYEMFTDEDERPVRFQEQPVYVHKYGDGEGGPMDLLLFTGRRWIITDGYRISGNATADSRFLADFLRRKFHPSFSDYSYAYISGPMDVGSPTYHASPESLFWYRTRRSGSPNETSVAQIEIGSLVVAPQFLCEVCNKYSNPCGNNHNCDRKGVCNCRKGYAGALCEGVHKCDAEKYRCLNGGVCTDDGTCKCGATPASSRFYGAFCELDRLGGPEALAQDWAASSSSWHGLSKLCGCNETRQAEYRGTLNVTKSGIPCQPWDSQEPHQHFFTSENFPESGLAGNNYCRNPRYQTRAFCVTSDPKNKFEACDVPYCADSICPATIKETCGCRNAKQSDYRGTINVTTTGRSCLPWSAVEDHLENGFEEGELEENYCRNPGQARKRAFCYTRNQSSVQTQDCDVPNCPTTVTCDANDGR